MHACLLIPAFEPGPALFHVISQTIAECDGTGVETLDVLVVNDGSRAGSALSLFRELRAKFPTLHYLELSRNRGKGAALKAGLGYIELSLPSVEWIVTADADGQHLPKDILHLLAAGRLATSPVLGVREFGAEVPWRSRIGNAVTRYLFRILYGRTLLDTQTGLRGFARDKIPGLLRLKSDRYEFETDALIQFCRAGTVRQIPVSTVYEPGNPTSHFDPLLDSMRIYAVLFRYVTLMTMGMMAEVTLVVALSHYGSTVEGALLIARCIAATGVFYGLRRWVFLSTNAPLVGQALKFVALVAANLLLTIYIVNLITENFETGRVPALLVAYLVFFAANFLIQRFAIFKRSRH